MKIKINIKKQNLIVYIDEKSVTNEMLHYQKY